MRRRRYEGFSTYETWLVNHWLNGSQGIREYWLQKAVEHQRNAAKDCGVVEGMLSESDEALFDLMDELSHQIGDHTETSLQSELIKAAFYQVNWQEIAEVLLMARIPVRRESPKVALSNEENETPGRIRKWLTALIKDGATTKRGW